MSSPFKDLRLAARTLIRSPTFSLAFVLTLALSIGCVTALFSVVHGVLLRPLPFPEPETLATFEWRSEEGVSDAASAAKVRFWQEHHGEAFESVAAFELKGAGVTLLGGNEPEYVRSLKVSGTFFRTLGATPQLGRGLLPEEDRPGGPCAVVLSHDLWRDAFGSDSAITRRQVRLDDRSCAVVGVMGEDFRFQPAADLWTPLRLDGADRRGANLYGMVARLRTDVSWQQARSQTDLLFSRYLATAAESEQSEETGVVLTHLRERLVGDLRSDLLLLFGAGGLVFLICCVNLSSLVVTRAIRRARETATRVALGAGWLDILRQTVVEISLISLVSAVGGWLLARGLMPVLLMLQPGNLPAIAKVQVAGVEALFAALAAFLALLLVAVVPVLRMARGGLSDSLRSVGDEGAAAGVRDRQLGRWLVVGQVALSLAVLMGSFTLIGGLMELRAVDPGFETESLWTFQIPLQEARFASPRVTSRFADELRRRLGEVPGVQRAATATSLPLEPGLNVPVHVQGHPQEGDNALEYRAVSPGYFETLGIQTVRGRGFTPQDGAESAPVVIVNEALARRYWGPGEALGQTVEIAKGLGALEDAPRRVVGVVADVRDVDLGSTPEPILYVPQAQVPAGLQPVINEAFPLSAIVRLDRGSLGMADLRGVLREIGPRQAVATVRPLRDLVRESLARERFYTLLLGLFGTLAMLLTALGIYAVANSQVSRRVREIGLRMAIGARVSEVLRMVLGESLKLAGLGILFGIPLAVALQRLIGSLVPDTVSAGGMLAFVLVAAVMAAVALLASLLPAHRATRVDPIVILH